MSRFLWKEEQLSNITYKGNLCVPYSFIIFGNGHWRDQGVHALWSCWIYSLPRLRLEKAPLFSFPLMLVGKITAFFTLYSTLA